MIGIFDSGSGGLSVLRAVREELPSADVVYFGDIKNAPYGSRSQAELSALTISGFRLLKEHGANRIVSACNSVSASLAVSLVDALVLGPGDLVEMVGPTVSYFKHADARLALVATEATIKSGIYQNGFHMIGKEVRAIAIPDLAAAVEFGESPETIRKIIEDALLPHRGQFDVLVLACTHYPLVAEAFQEVLGAGVLIFDPAQAVAERAKKLFWPQEVGAGSARFLVSKDSTVFRNRVAEIMQDAPHAIEVLE